MSELLGHNVRAILRTILAEEGFDPDSTYDIYEGDIILWVSSIYRVIVHVDRPVAGNNRLFLFLKCLPENPDIREALDTDIFFRNEVAFYNKVLNPFLEFQEKRNVKNPFCAAPKCYRAHSDVLVLEDLKPRGFVMLDRLKLMGLEELHLVMQELGRFHALSLAMKDQEPNSFARVRTAVTETVFYERFLDKFGQLYEFVMSDALKMVKHNFPEHSNYFTKFKLHVENICDRMMELVRPKEEDEQYNVITHGDLWVSNFMFHYPDFINVEEQPSCVRKPDQMKLLDFQVSRFASPALDVSYILLSSAGKATRDAHQKSLLHSYHDSLSELLRDLGSDPEFLFPFTALEGQLKKYTEFGLWLTLFNLPHTLDEGESVDGNRQTGAVEEDAEGQVSIAISAVYSRKSQQCQERILDAIKDVIDSEYLK